MVLPSNRVIGNCRWIAGLYRIFTAGLTIMELHFYKSYQNGVVHFRNLRNQKIQVDRDLIMRRFFTSFSLRWLPRVFTNNPSYLAYVTERNLVTLSLRFCSRDSPLRLPI